MRNKIERLAEMITIITMYDFNNNIRANTDKNSSFVINKN